MVVHSNELLWNIIENQNAHRHIQKGLRHSFSKDKNNLTGLNTFKYNGLIYDKTLSVTEASDKNGIVVEYAKPKNKRFPSNSKCRINLKKGCIKKLNKIVKKHRFLRKDLLMPALRKASAILESQRQGKKKKTAKKSK